MGILLNGRTKSLSIPEDKITKAYNLVAKFSQKCKATVRDVQQLAGTLNFLNRAIVPGRVFMCRMYAKFANLGKKVKKYHHVRIDAEFRNDCKVWMTFLQHPTAFARPMIDFEQNTFTAIELDFYTDASLNEFFGFGCVFGIRWTFGKWEKDFIKINIPSICYLELYALCVGVLTWSHLIQNKRVVIFCDNQATVNIVINLGSKCKNCMQLLRILTLDNLINNRRVFAKYVNTKLNSRADLLSRMKFETFFKIAGKQVNPEPSPLPERIWPLSKIWIRN